jgi:hypothetical protein
MAGSGEEERETMRPHFDRSIMIDFQGAKITSDTGFLLLREIDERFGWRLERDTKPGQVSRGYRGLRMKC